MSGWGANISRTCLLSQAARDTQIWRAQMCVMNIFNDENAQKPPQFIERHRKSKPKHQSKAHSKSTAESKSVQESRVRQRNYKCQARHEWRFKTKHTVEKKRNCGAFPVHEWTYKNMQSCKTEKSETKLVRDGRTTPC